MTSKSVKKQDIFVSAVVIAKAEACDLAKYVSSLSRHLKNYYTNYEILVIDNRATIEEIASVNKLLVKLPCIRLIRLSRQYKHDTAVFTGLEAAIGDFVVILDPVLDPIEDVSKIVETNRSYDIVQGVSTIPIKGVFGTDTGRRLFYWYNRKYLGIDIPLQSTYFMSLNRRAVSAITATKRHDRHVRHLSKAIGYKFITFNYEPLENPSSQRSLRTGAIQAIEIVSSYSTHPLRLVTWLGFLAGCVNLIYGIYVLIVAFFNNNVEPGWTTMSMQLSAMFFVLFTILVVFSEYIGRILSESRQDPHYLIMDEFSSTVSLADVERKNITKG